MAAPTTQITETATVAATGEANGVLKIINPKIQNARLRLGFSGTYASAVAAVRGRLRGINTLTTGGEYYALQGRNLATGAAVADHPNERLQVSGPTGSNACSRVSEVRRPRDPRSSERGPSAGVEVIAPEPSRDGCRPA